MELPTLLAGILAGVFVVLMLLQLRDFLTLLPYLLDSLFRARGSVALENSIPVSRMRYNIAFTLLIPFVLVLWRCRLWSPAFLQDWPASLQFAALCGSVLLYLSLRYLMYRLLMPPRRADFYQLSHRVFLTHFILFCVLLFFPSFGVLNLADAPDPVCKAVLLGESALFFFLLLLRRAQILSLSCNPLRTFSYLCGIEILPAALWAASAAVL